MATPSNLVIPEGQIPLFEALVAASEDEISSLLEAVENAELQWSRAEFIRQLALSDHVPIDLARAFVAVATSLLSTSESAIMPRESLVDGVVNGVLLDSKPIREDTKAQERLRTLLSHILERAGTLNVSNKIQRLAVDNERIFLSARIVTDLRPIFGSDESEVVASIPLHTLRVTSGTDGQERSSRFVLDRNDLVRLRTLVDRALAKEDALRSIADGTKLSLLAPPPDGSSDD